MWRVNLCYLWYQFPNKFSVFFSSPSWVARNEIYLQFFFKQNNFTWSLGNFISIYFFLSFHFCNMWNIEIEIWILNVKLYTYSSQSQNKTKKWQSVLLLLFLNNLCRSKSHMCYYFILWKFLFLVFSFVKPHIIHKIES